MNNSEASNKATFNIVMVHPEIPHNTGAAGRLALATGARLHLVKPLGFDIDEKTVKRAGLDYWKDVDLVLWESWDEFYASVADTSRMFLLTTKATKASLGGQVSRMATTYALWARETKRVG